MNKLSKCPTFQKGTLRIPTPQPRFVDRDWAELGMVGGRELWIDIADHYGNNLELLKDSSCEARLETLRYRSTKTGRRSAGFVVIGDMAHNDSDGNLLPQRKFTFPFSDVANFSSPIGDEGVLLGRIPFWSLFKLGQIRNHVTNQVFNVPVVTGERFSNDAPNSNVPRWSGGKMDLYLRFRISLLNAEGIREAGPESTTIRIAPYPYPVHVDGGSDTIRLGIGMAEGPIYG